MDIYYVYAYISKRDRPYYIGKGCKTRAYRPHGYVSVPKDKSRIMFLKENMSEADAFELEKLLIKYFGRRDCKTGILFNMTDGGDGPSGSKRNVENYRKPKSPEHKAKLAAHLAKVRTKPFEWKKRPEHSKRMMGNKFAIGQRGPLP